MNVVDVSGYLWRGSAPVERIDTEYSFPPCETCCACGQDHEIVRPCYACQSLVCRGCACAVEGSTGDVACPTCEGAFVQLAPPVAIFRLDEEIDTTLEQLIAVNDECPIDDDELDEVRALSVGDSTWLSCGGGATMITRVA